MAGITQTIPQFSLGISEQPDNLKFPGQVTEIVNAIPDVTKGLYKRPGAARIGSTPLASVQSGGSWFHYYRDEAEGSYIGQVAADGQLRVWKASGDNAGALQNITYGTGGQTAIQNYLQTAASENLQFLTINDSTFVNNRDSTTARAPYTTVREYFSATYSQSGTTITVTFIDHGLAVEELVYADFTSGTASDANLVVATVADANTFTLTAASSASTSGNVTITPLTQQTPHKYYAFLELLRSENGRQYGLDIFNDATTKTLNRATKLKMTSDNLDESDDTGHCPGIGTQVFTVSAASSYSGTTTEYVRSTALTPATVTGGASAVNVASDYITFPSAHNFLDGDAVVYTHGTSTAIGGLTSGTTYYVRNGPVSGGVSLYFYTSESNALANTSAINLTDQGGLVTHTFTPTLGVLATSEKDNLTFRLNILGQQGTSPTNNSKFRCSYQREVVLLHGGEGWVTGDQVKVTLDSAQGGANTDGGSTPDDNASYVITIEDHESTSVNANLALLRPAPTPFDADTAVTADTILGSITAVANSISGISTKVIGNGIYFFSDTTSFNINVVEDDLMRVMQSSVNDVQDLPNQCKNGYIVKIANARISDEDDYYLRFDGQNGKDGNGSWAECAASAIPRRLHNMPLVIQRDSLANPGTDNEIATFVVKQFTYGERAVGDTGTNTMPSFLDKRVNKVLFFRNRLAFLAEENVVTCRPGTLGKPDFFVETALTVSTADPIDISAASMFPSELFDGMELNTGLLIFSTNQQFLLASDDTVLNPDTAKLRSISTFNYNKKIAPISLGTTVAYVDNSNKFSRFNEMANVAREGEPNVLEVTKVVPTVLSKNIDLLTNSRENSIVLFGKTGSDEVVGYKYFQTADKRVQAAWFKWKLNNPLIYHFIIDDEYYFLDSDYFLQKIQLIQSDSEPSITENSVEFLLHLDNFTTVSGGVYNATTKKTTFTNQSDWIDQVTTPNGALVVIDTNSATARRGRYAVCTVINSDDFTLPGDWQTGVTTDDPLTIGYLYDYQVKFPTIYPTKIQGSNSTADVNSSLVLHRIKLHFGKVGLYETTLERVGKNDYTEVYESTELDEYDVADAPYLEEFIKTIPVYERNTNVEITLKSAHPSPATLRSMSWEGDYSPKYYRRV